MEIYLTIHMFIARYVVTHDLIRMDISLLRIVIKIGPLMVIGYKLILHVLGIFWRKGYHTFQKILFLHNGMWKLKKIFFQQKFRINWSKDRKYVMPFLAN